MSLEKDKTIFIAGHRGMVGSAILRRLRQSGYANILTRDRAELDLTRQAEVERFFAGTPVDVVIIAAAKVGGIHANNTYPAEFIYLNLMIECNLIHAAHAAGVQRLLFLGSSCIYPRHAPQPMTEACLLEGKLEETNEPYAIAKIAGIKLCESYNRQYGRDYRSLMPTNLYGPNDNFHPENSHVIPALIRRIHEAKIAALPEVVIWGTGTPRREFLHVDDLAVACLHVLDLDPEAYRECTRPMLSHLNVGSGTDVTIRELAETIARVVGYNGRLVFDATKPDGTPRKLLDVTKIQALGWQPGIGLEEGLRNTYRWFLQYQLDYRK